MAPTAVGWPPFVVLDRWNLLKRSDYICNMRVSKTYAGGGLLSNSFEKFDDMAGASGPIGSSYAKNRFGFGTKGGALRREKRAIKKSLAGGMQGPAAENYQDRLDYLKKVQGHRAKKVGAAIGTAALVAGTAGLATGAIGAGAAGAGGAGAAGAGAGAAGAGAGAAAGGGAAGLAGGGAGTAATFGDKILKGLKIAKAGKDLVTPTPEQQEQVDSGDFGQPDEFMNYGGKIGVLKAEEGVKVPEGADVRSLLASLDKFSEEKKRRRKMEERQFNEPTPDKEMNDKILSLLLEKFKDSAPSIMGAKATDRYYNR